MNLFAEKTSSHAVLILGAGKRAGKLYQEIVKSKIQGQCSIGGFVPLEEQDSAIPQELILQGDDALVRLAREMEISEIVIVQDHPAQKCPMQQLLDCKLAGIELSDLDSFLERVRGENNLQEEYFEPMMVNYN